LVVEVVARETLVAVVVEQVVIFITLQQYFLLEL
jgi:hypothetical protein